MPRTLFLCLLLVAPGTVFAHSPMPGIGYFYGGILHPLLVPSHLLVLVALGLFVGQRGLTAMRFAYPCFLAALTAGLILAGFFPEMPPTVETVLLSFAACCGLAVALKLPTHPVLVALVALMTAFFIGADSGVADLDRRETFGALLGAGAGACILLIFCGALAELPRREWQKVLVRVLGSWCAASAALVLALALR